MQVKKIDTTAATSTKVDYRPMSFRDFVGQHEITRVVQTAIASSKKSERVLGHMLLLGPAGYGKTTLAQIIAYDMGTHCKVVTAYALSKPADVISMLNSLSHGDVLFIDEIHRLPPKLEEMLYTAMEDYRIDMVMPDGGHVSIPLQPFTLIGATTKSDHLSKPLKSRFVYKFHFADYTDTEKQKILGYYLTKLGVSYEPLDVVIFARLLETIPRELYNGCVRLYDYLNAHHTQLVISPTIIESFAVWNNTHEGGLNSLHRAYLELFDHTTKPMSLNTIAVKLGLDEQTVEEEIEPLLVKLGYIDRTPKGRVKI
ncbi:MAG TPA: Holliday junction DNA helicase RuvB C-terminal domain-containing protein [Candidatus Absconditabacterales bacterium]|nr:Holliday junction DNA helicase RuvB C-terminal domain-containing protein [Candidatus Absconditabacterales bacterium]